MKLNDRYLLQQLFVYDINTKTLSECEKGTKYEIYPPTHRDMAYNMYTM